MEAAFVAAAMAPQEESSSTGQNSRDRYGSPVVRNDSGGACDFRPVCSKESKETVRHGRSSTWLPNTLNEFHRDARPTKASFEERFFSVHRGSRASMGSRGHSRPSHASEQPARSSSRFKMLMQLLEQEHEATVQRLQTALQRHLDQAGTIFEKKKRGSMSTVSHVSALSPPSPLASRCLPFSSGNSSEVVGEGPLAFGRSPKTSDRPLSPPLALGRMFPPHHTSSGGRRRPHAINSDDSDEAPLPDIPEANPDADPQQAAKVMLPEIPEQNPDAAPLQTAKVVTRDEPGGSIPLEERVPSVPSFAGPRSNLYKHEAAKDDLASAAVADKDHIATLSAAMVDATCSWTTTPKNSCKKHVAFGEAKSPLMKAGGELHSIYKAKNSASSLDLRDDEVGCQEDKPVRLPTQSCTNWYASDSGTTSEESTGCTETPVNEKGKPKSLISRPTGPIVFTLLESWVEREDLQVCDNSKMLASCMGPTRSSLQDVNFFMVSEAEDLSNNGSNKVCLNRFVMNPSSPSVQAFDVLLMCVVIYDACAIPLLVFELSKNWWSNTIEWFIRIVWTVEIPRSFLTGFVLKNGTAEMRPKFIAAKYIRTWFLFDCCIAGFDWAEWVFLARFDIDTAQQGGAVRLFARFRMARVVPRIMRLSRLPRLAERMGDVFYSQKNTLFIGIGKVSILFIFLIHYIACSWYGLGVWIKGKTWLDDYKWWDETFARQYAICLHWAITQFIGNIEVTPVNVAERYFSAFGLIFSFFASASFVSRLAASMTRLHMLTGQQDMKIALLRQWLCHHSISAELCGRVVRSAEYAEKQKSKIILEADVDLLTVITEPLMMEIHLEVYAKTLCLHPFFTFLQRIDMGTMRRICHRSAACFSLTAGDVLFNQGERPSSPQMFFLTKGMMLYVKPEHRIMVETGTFICEKVLWTNWMHVGTLFTYSNCTLASVDAAELQMVMVGHHSAEFAIKYAEVYLAHLNFTMENDPDLVDDLNDGDFKTMEMAREIAGSLERRKKMSQTVEEQGIFNASLLVHSEPLEDKPSKTRPFERFTTLTRLSGSGSTTLRNLTRRGTLRGF